MNFWFPCLYLWRVRTIYVIYHAWLSIFPVLGDEFVMVLLSFCKSFDFSDPFCILGLATGNAEMSLGQTLPWT